MFLTALGYYHDVRKDVTSKKDHPHIAAQIIGKTVVALLVIGIILTLHGLSIAGVMGSGPFAPIGFYALIISGGLVSFEALTLLGIVLRALGVGQPKQVVLSPHPIPTTQRIETEGPYEG